MEEKTLLEEYSINVMQNYSLPISGILGTIIPMPPVPFCPFAI